MKGNKVYLGLGSNIGNREKNLNKALEEISLTCEITKKSSIHETKPIGLKNQRDFLNMVIEVKTNKEPLELLLKLQEIERKMGRIRSIKNGPRIIDIDILTYNDAKINKPNLTIPHPRMFDRDFVMKPLKEITHDFDNR